MESQLDKYNKQYAHEIPVLQIIEEKVYCYYCNDNNCSRLIGNIGKCQCMYTLVRRKVCLLCKEIKHEIERLKHEVNVLCDDLKYDITAVYIYDRDHYHNQLYVLSQSLRRLNNLIMECSARKEVDELEEGSR
jgi:hypothetical protein